MQKFQLEPFTKQELDVLGHILDIALKAEGLQILKQSALLLTKIEQVKPVQEENNNGTTETTS